MSLSNSSTQPAARRRGDQAAQPPDIGAARLGDDSAKPQADDTSIELRDLVVEFALPRQRPLQRRPRIRAVAGVSLTIRRGESLGLVGESGSGKSTIARVLVGLVKPASGEILFEGAPMPAPSSAAFRALRRQIQMIFQDPYSSLNPYMTAEEIIGEPIVIHHLASSSAARKQRVLELLHEVGLRGDHMSRRPHEFSGGQRQRIGIARALAVQPSFVIADEAVSALDVSIQAQILNLLVRLKARHDLTYLFIAHDLAVVRQVCDRVAVMYLGKLMELAESRSLYSKPLHPYTQALLAAVPIPDPDVEASRKRVIVSGDLPSSVTPPPGCVFHTRCPIAIDKCRSAVPDWRNVGTSLDPHWVACHRV